MTPLELSMLLHFYAMSHPFLAGPLQGWPPSQRNAVTRFLGLRLIEQGETPTTFHTTDLGDELVREIQDAARMALLKVRL